MMRRIGSILVLFLLVSCQERNSVSVNTPHADWNDRKAGEKVMDAAVQGKTYLPVYSHIYHIQQDRIFNLTVTASIRNISSRDTVYLLKADYYNTTGMKVREYLEFPVYICPMETLEIIIGETDETGGSGANFIFDWAMGEGVDPPLFEAVMISTHGQQGLSFTTRGVEITHE